jgi:hypothetical protein
LSDIVDVLLGDAGTPIAILGSRMSALTHPDGLRGRVKLDYPRTLAVDSIRRIVFDRDSFECQHCGEFVTWTTGHLDEIVSRGDGGAVSVSNCQVLCPKCHIVGPESKHGKKRSVRFGQGKK